MKVPTTTRWRYIRLLSVSLALMGSAMSQNGGDGCSNALAVTEGTYFYDTQAASTSGYASATCNSGLVFNKDQFYSYTAPSTGQLSVYANATFNPEIALYFGGDCASTCASESVGGTVSAFAEIPHLNAGQPVLIQIGGASANDFGMGDLTTRFYADPFEQNDTCSTAHPIQPGPYSGLHLTWQDLDYYSITIPSLMKLRVDLDNEFLGPGNWDFEVKVYSHNCNLLAVDSVPQGSTFTYSNNSSTPRKLIFSVDIPVLTMGVNEVYDMSVLVEHRYPHPCPGSIEDVYEENDDCQSATVLPGDGTYPNLVLGDLDPDYYITCVQAGATLAVEVQSRPSPGTNLLSHLSLSRADSPTCGSAPLLAHDIPPDWTDQGTFVEWTNNTGTDVRVAIMVDWWGGASTGTCREYDMTVWGSECGPNNVGSPFCGSPNPSSSGLGVVVHGTGETGIGSGLRLEATNGPPGDFGYFLVGTGINDPGVQINNGYLCLATATGNMIWRYNAGSFRNSISRFDLSGRLENTVGTSSTGFGFDVPTVLPGNGSITAGSTWHFQLWFRDSYAGVGLANFSSGLSINF